MSSAIDLSNGLSALGLVVAQPEQQKMLALLLLMQKWNKVYNLTAIRDPRQMVSNHLLDSLAVLPHLKAGRWIDVGCGAGLPGLVLAIAKPDWPFTLLDSNSKKTSFVQQASIELGLGNIDVQCKRVEDWQALEKYDGVISRAFAETAEFVSTTRHLLKEGGTWAAMKGNPEEELKHLPKGVLVKEIISLRVPNLDATRCLVVLRENK